MIITGARERERGYDFVLNHINVRVPDTGSCMPESATSEYRITAAPITVTKSDVMYRCDYCGAAYAIIIM